jgi:hypothetical protein
METLWGVMWGAPTILRVAVHVLQPMRDTNLRDRLARCSTNLPALLTPRIPALHYAVIACFPSTRVGDRRHLTNGPNEIKIESLQKSGELTHLH